MSYKYLRFLNNLDEQISKSVSDRLMQRRDQYGTLATGTQTARWIGCLMDDLTVEIGEVKARAIMEACGQQCIGQSVLDKARSLKQNSSDIDEYLKKLNDAHIGGGKLRREKDDIYGFYERCYCGSVSKTRQPISTVYCQCSCGWYKKLFEATLERPVKVELIDSIIHGATSCRFIIHL